MKTIINNWKSTEVYNKLSNQAKVLLYLFLFETNKSTRLFQFCMSKYSSFKKRNTLYDAKRELENAKIITMTKSIIVKGIHYGTEFRFNEPVIINDKKSTSICKYNFQSDVIFKNLKSPIKKILYIISFEEYLQNDINHDWNYSIFCKYINITKREFQKHIDYFRDINSKNIIKFEKYVDLNDVESIDDEFINSINNYK